MRRSVLVACRLEGVSGRAAMRLTDLSIGGCFVETTVAYPVGTTVTVYADLRGTEVALTGRVINVLPRGFGFAVEFDQLPENTRHQLNAFLQEAQTS